MRTDLFAPEHIKTIYPIVSKYLKTKFRVASIEQGQLIYKHYYIALVPFNK